MGSITRSEFFSPMSFMRQTLLHYIEYNSTIHSEGTLSILNLAKTTELVRWQRDFFRLLTVAMEDPKIVQHLKKARTSCELEESHGEIDLSTFLRNFALSFAADNQALNYRSPFFDLIMLYASKGIYLVSQIVEGSYSTYHVPYAHGISIMFPAKRPYKYSPDLSKPWHQFLNKFYAATEKKSPEISLEAL